MTEQLDFTGCTKILGRAYNGANGKKIAIEYDGSQYMLKFPPSGERKPTNLSYTNSCISEHIASSIFNLLGMKSNGNWSAAMGAIRLLHHISRMIQGRMEDERKGRISAIDRKLKRKIDEKKLAHGLRQG